MRQKAEQRLLGGGKREQGWQGWCLHLAGLLSLLLCLWQRRSCSFPRYISINYKLLSRWICTATFRLHYYNLSSTPPLHLDRVRAAISVNLQPAAVTRKIGGTVAHLRRCMGRRTSARGTSDIEGEFILGTSSAAYFLDAWWYKT